ncbi:MAG: Translation initiation factor 1, partial [uncultured Gemmatimonadetes bacterium]
GEGRDRDARRRDRRASRHPLPGEAGKRPRAAVLHLGPHAQELHPHSGRRPRDGGAVAVRPDPRPHHLSVQV